MKKRRVLKKRLKYFLGIYTVTLLFVLVTIFTTSAKYSSSITKTSSNISIARPIITIENDTNTRNIVNGSKVIKYFNVMNYENNNVTDVAMDYYIKIVDGNNNVISDARVYYQTYDDDPNHFTEITKETSGTYNGYYKGVSFTTARKSQGYKLIVDKVTDYDEINIKVIAIQKEVTS